jgi:CheY-like chemotaxis protein
MPDGLTPLAVYMAFHAAHAAHGPLVVGADEPQATGYRAWVICPCGEAWTRWVSLDEALMDFDAEDPRAALRASTTEREGLPRATHLAIVERGRAGVYAALKARFEPEAGSAPLRVLWDRRQGARRHGVRRRHPRPEGLDRRRADRRHALPATWTSLGFLLVSAPEPTPRTADLATGMPTMGLSPRGREIVLLVDDEPELRHLIEEILRGQGYLVLTAADGNAALELAAHHPGPIDLVVADVTMIPMRGPEPAARLTASRPALKVLYISGSFDPRDAPVILDAGAPGAARRPWNEEYVWASGYSTGTTRGWFFSPIPHDSTLKGAVVLAFLKLCTSLGDS